MPVAAVSLFKPFGKAKAGAESILPGCTLQENLSTRTEEIQKIGANMLEKLQTGWVTDQATFFTCPKVGRYWRTQNMFWPQLDISSILFVFLIACS